MRIFCTLSAAVILVIFSVVLVGMSATVYQPRHHHSQQVKALRSRQIGTQGQVVARMFSPDYDNNIRPPVRDSADHSAIVVTTSVYLNRIVWHKHSAEVDLYLRQQWEDSRLAYDVDTREGILEVTIPKNKQVWQPDTIFGGNSFAGQEQQQGGQTIGQRSRIIVEPSGYVRVREKRYAHVAAETDDAFPVSNHRSFKLTISSNSYTVDDVVYLWANSPPTVLPIEVSDELYDDDAEYAFQHAEASDCVGNYTSGAFGCIQIVVHFKGRATDGWLKVIFPCVILAIASWLHFWVSGTWSVPRSISAAFPFFIFIALLLFFRIETCALLVWLVACTLFTFFSLLEYFLVIN